MSHGNMSNFVWFPLFEFTLVIKPKNFDFESVWNTLIFFDQLKIMPDLNISYETVSDLGRILAIKWKIRILNFIEVV